MDWLTSTCHHSRALGSFYGIDLGGKKLSSLLSQEVRPRKHQDSVPSIARKSSSPEEETCPGPILMSNIL